MAEKQIVVGGYPPSTFVDQCNTLTEVWTTSGTAAPVSVWDGLGAEVNSDGSCIMCWGTGAAARTDIYDYNTEQWTQKDDRPAHRDQQGCSSDSSYAYEYGGRLSGITTETEIHRYDIAANSWTDHGDLDIARRQTRTAWAGDVDRTNTNGGLLPAIASSTSDYTISSNTCVAGPTMNVATYAHASAGEGHFGTYIYKTGGGSTTTEVLEPPSGTWTTGGTNGALSNYGFAGDGGNFEVSGAAAEKISYPAGTWTALANNRPRSAAAAQTGAQTLSGTPAAISIDSVEQIEHQDYDASGNPHWPGAVKIVYTLA